MKTINKIPTYKEAVELCSFPESPFYESKMIVDGYNIIRNVVFKVLILGTQPTEETEQERRSIRNGK
jgi:hypothetical protein